MTEEEMDEIFGSMPGSGIDQTHPNLDGMPEAEREERIEKFLQLAEWDLAGHDNPTNFGLLAATAAKRAIRLYRSGLYFDALRSAIAAGSMDTRYSILWGLFESPRPICSGKYGEICRAFYSDPASHFVAIQGEQTEDDIDDMTAEFDHFGFDVERDDIAEAVRAWKDGQGYYVLRDETEFHTEGNRDTIRLVATHVASPPQHGTPENRP